MVLYFLGRTALYFHFFTVEIQDVFDALMGTTIAHIQEIF